MPSNSKKTRAGVVLRTVDPGAYCSALLARVQAREASHKQESTLADCRQSRRIARHNSMGDSDELAVLILSGWSDGPLPALEHSLRQRGLRCVRVPLPMPPCGVYWCANPFLLLLTGVVWLMIYALNEVTLEPAALYIVLIIAGALVAARLCVAGVVRFAEWHGAANARRLLARHRVALVVGFSWGGGIAHRLLASRSWRGPTLLLAPTTIAMARCALRSPQRLDDARLKVVLASDDGFVPRPATESLYEAVAVVPDDHPLCGRAARDAIAGASAELLSEPLLLGAPT